MIKKKFIAILMSALVVASTPVFAAYTYPELSGTGITGVTFDTVINGTAGVTLPAISPSYSVGSVSGPDGGSSGSPVITTEVIAANTTIPSGGTLTKSSTVSFNGVTFTKPGEYIWPITSTTNVSGLTFESSPKYLHVFIEDQTTEGNTPSTTLKKGGVFLSSTQGNVWNVAAADTGKTTSFEGTYGTKTLTVNTRVTGNMGNKTQPFVYTVTLTGCPNGTVIEGVTADNNTVTINKTNTHGDSFVIHIPDIANIQYEVSQEPVDGYTTSVQTETQTQP